MDKKTALLIIDVQVEMFSHPEFPLFRGDELIKNISYLIEKAHKTGTPVIYVQHTEGDNEPMGKGKTGWQIHPEIAPRNDEMVILKYTPDSFHETELHKALASKNIGRLVIAGLQTEYCIDTTCRRAFSLGYETILVKDGHSTFNSRSLTAPQIVEHHNRILGDWFVKLLNAEEVVY